MRRVIAGVAAAAAIGLFLGLADGVLAQTKGGTGDPPGDAKSGAATRSQSESNRQTRTESGANITCFGTKFGLSCLTDQGWQSYTESDGLPRDRISDMALCDGRFLIGAGRAVVWFDGESFSEPNQIPSGTVRNVSCEGDGRYWVSNSRQVSYWNGSGWVVHSNEQIIPDDRHRSINGIAAGPQGTVWVTIFRGRVAHYNGQSWQVWSEGQGFERRNIFREIHVTRDGQVMVPSSRGTFVYRDGQWSTMPGAPDARYVTEDQAGNLIMTRGSRISLFDGTAFQNFEVTYDVREAVRDSRGRIWAATEFGGALIENGQARAFQMHNSNLIDNDIVAVGVLGAGGVLPGEISKPTGVLSGRFEWRDGPPVPNARVQVCGISRGILSRNREDGPCAGRPLFGEGMTDETGAFTIQNLQSAHYRLAIFVGGRWVSYRISGDRARVMPGETRTMGTLRVNTRYRTSEE